MLKSSITTKPRGQRRLKPMHPGEVLREEFMEPLGLSAGKIAKAAAVPRTRIERIAREEIGITADTALRLAKVFGTSHDFWINLQVRYDLLLAEAELARELPMLKSLADV